MSEYQIQKALGTTKQFWVCADVKINTYKIYIALLVDALSKDCAISCTEKYLLTADGEEVVINEFMKNIKLALDNYGITIDRIGVRGEQEKEVGFQPDLFQE